MIFLVLIIEKAYRRIPVQFGNGTDSYIPVKLTTAGNVPSSWANSMTAVLSLLLMPSMAGGQQVHDILLWLAVFFGPGQAGRFIAYSIFVVFFYYLFTAFFYNPKHISAYLKDRTAEFNIPSEGDSHFVNRSLERMAVIGCLYFLGIILFIEIAGRATQTMVFASDGVKLIVMVCIALDLANEVHMGWKSRDLVNVAEFQEPWKAGLLKNVLQQNRIPCFIRGYYHRALMYFFGPFVEMAVFVPAEKAKAATEHIERHGGLGY
jgi:preprotein translocase subunit SecY